MVLKIPLIVIVASLLMLSAASQGRFATYQPKAAPLPVLQVPKWPAAISSEKPAAVNQRAAFIITPDYYTRHMAWTCRQEWQLEKITSLPLRLRLGGLEQVNWLEGKNQTHR
jgi:hypothetical protein